MPGGDICALHHINLTVTRGEFVAIMGPSGSGKSTLLTILGCLDRPTSGLYWLDGQNVSTLNDTALARIRNRQIGFVFQSYHLMPRMDVLNNVILPLLYSGLSRSRRREAQAREALERVGLSHRLRHRPAELSGGEQQRVAIARALITDPVVILADEPTGNLDSNTGTEIMTLLQACHAEGRTLVLVTHDAEIARRAQRIMYLKDGTLAV